MYPCGDRPLAANLNYVAGQVVPNAVIAPLSPTGEVCVYSLVGTHIVADVNGWFAKNETFVPLTPLRVFDTRPSEPQGAVTVEKHPYGGGKVLRVDVRGVGGVPFHGAAIAVSLNVTVVDPAGAGFITVFPCGDRPLAANLNYVRGQVVPNAVIAPVSAQGEVCFYSSADAHLIADVNGWFHVGGEYRALSPARLFDTRPTDPQGVVSVTKQRYGGATELRISVAGAAGVPTTGVAAVSLNVTVADAVGAGFLTVHPCGVRPLAANLNYVAGQVVPNAVIAPVSAAGEICIYSLVDAHIIADVSGWFAS